MAIWCVTADPCDVNQYDARQAADINSTTVTQPLLTNNDLLRMIEVIATKNHLYSLAVTTYCYQTSQQSATNPFVIYSTYKMSTDHFY